MKLIILAFIFIFSLILIHRNTDKAVRVLLVLSVLLHKEVFSIYKWDFLPVRFFMLALFFYGAFRFMHWFLKERDFQKIKNFVSDPFILVILLIWLVRGISIIFTKNLTASVQYGGCGIGIGSSLEEGKGFSYSFFDI